MDDSTTTIRPRFGRFLTVLVGVIVVIALGALLISGDFAGLIRGGAALALLGFVTWMLFWTPRVSIGPAGVEFVNLIRTHRVTWPAIQRIDTKYALTLFTPQGKFVAWAAPAPGRLAASRAVKHEFQGLPESTYGAERRIGIGDLPSSDSGLAGFYVRRQWEQYREAGLLDRIDGTGVVTTWHWPTIAIFGALAVATAAGALL